MRACPRTANQGWTVGTRGGSFAYSGGGTSTINNKITGVGGFTYYSRGIGGGNGMTIQLNNNLAAGGGGNDDYQGTTSFLENPAQGGQGDTANNWGSHSMDARTIRFPPIPRSS